MNTVTTLTPASSAQSAVPVMGVVDVGSNSVRLVVFEDGFRSPDYFFNEKTICRLGEGLSTTGRLNPEGKLRAMAALRRFVELSEHMGVSKLVGVGTAAMRDAEDAPAFRDEIARETGLEIMVAMGNEEARLSASGVLLGWPDARGVIADIGGASLELARVDGDQISRAVTTPAGHLRLIDRDAPDAQSALRALRTAATDFGEMDGPLILIGGAWRGLAKAQMSRTEYPLHVLMGYELSPEEALDLCDWAQDASPSELKKVADASSSRVRSIAGGAAALKTLLTTLQPESVRISAYGLREGLVYDRMHPAMRSQDPLIAAALRMEDRAARSPGFGAELFNWITPVIENMDASEQRLAHAACLLHDVNWRQHPDFRALACFATVTRANLSGVGHKGRIFIGAALLHRYKTYALDRDVSAALGLLPDDTLQTAQAVGRALRLGAMLTGSAKGMLGKSRLEIDGKELTLFLEPAVAVLAGERVERRLAALADCLGLNPHLVA